jgi:ABC-type transporter Mla subunit MlaD
MAIIFPANTRGLTAGAMRQIKHHGHTTAAGGWHAIDSVYNMAVDADVYLMKNEPLGRFMSALEKTAEDANALTDALLKSTTAMVEQARESNKQLNDVNGKMRDGAEKLGLAIERFNKVAGNTNFAETAKQAESLVNSLERLAALEASGMLEKVMKAMAK